MAINPANNGVIATITPVSRILDPVGNSRSVGYFIFVWRWYAFATGDASFHIGSSVGAVRPLWGLLLSSQRKSGAVLLT